MSTSTPTAKSFKGFESSYPVTQYRYAGKGGDDPPGFITVIEISFPRKGSGFLSLKYENRNGVECYTVAEFETLELATSAFDNALHTLSVKPKSLSGCVAVEVSKELPWFWTPSTASARTRV